MRDRGPDYAALHPGYTRRLVDARPPPPSPACRGGSESPRRVASEKRLDPGLGAAENQGVDVVGALVGVDGLEVRQHAHDVELVGDAVAAMHVAREARDVERLAAIVALH